MKNFIFLAISICFQSTLLVHAADSEKFAYCGGNLKFNIPPFTDGQGKTMPVRTVGLSEVLFVILNKNYKDLLGVNSNQNNDTHVIEKNETLSTIAKEHGTTVNGP